MQQVCYFFNSTLAVQALDSRITPSIDLFLQVKKGYNRYE